MEKPWREDAFKGYRVIVTGASSGIGRAIATEFFQHGAQVCLLARRLEVMEGIIQEDLGGSERAKAFKCDVTVEPELQSVVRAAIAHMGGLDVLVNNAGGGSSSQVSAAWEGSTFREIFELNVISAVVATSAAVEALLESKGSVVNISSIAATAGDDTIPSYGAAKAALDSFTRSFALKHAESGVRCNSILPAVIKTPIFKAFGMDDEAVEAMGHVHPVQRVGNVSEVAAAALFLSSRAAPFMTGDHIFVDGGAHLASSFWYGRRHARVQAATESATE